MIRNQLAAFAVIGCCILSGPVLAASDTSSTPKPGSTFKDCADCPRMVVVPAGTFMMGSTKEDEDREGISPQRPGPGGVAPKPRSESAINEQAGWSLPQHRVTIAKPFAIAQTHATRAQFAAFVTDTHRPDPDSCNIMKPYGNFEKTEGASWHNNGIKQSPNDAVTCVAWEDAKAYVDWLAKKTGKPYRLMSEAEYEYVARAGTTGQRFWGDKIEDACKYANVADQSTHKVYPNLPWINCNDGYPYTASDLKFKPNAFGVYGMLGNGYQWVMDCAHTNYEGAPTDGSAWMTGPCDRHAERGGAWFTGAYAIRAPKRGFNVPTARNADNSFRVALDL